MVLVLAQIDALASGQTSVGEVIVRLVEGCPDRSMSQACDSRSTSMWSVKPDVSEPGAFAVPRCGYLHHPSGTPHAVRTGADEDMEEDAA